MGVSENSEFSPQIIHFNRDFPYKPSILGYPLFLETPIWRLENPFTPRREPKICHLWVALMAFSLCEEASIFGTGFLTEEMIQKVLVKGTEPGR